MYNFVDTTEVFDGAFLPAEALKINGEYIEDIIPGYRTLSVSGREALSPELNTYETGSRDGASLKNKRYPARIIVVQYQLIAESAEAFRQAYNRLASVLNVKNAELIFNDETDKFFIGTPSAIGEVEPGRNAVTGEFEILCVDPFKYSVIEYEATPEFEDGSFLIEYGGTYKAYPTLEAEFYNEDEASEDGETVNTLTGAGDCGYVAFFTEDEKIIQLGNPDEVDGVNAYAKSQTLTNCLFRKANAWGTAAKSLLTVNNGKLSDSTMEQVGTVGMKVAKYTTPETPATTSATLLTAVSKANAPIIHYQVTAKTTNRTETSVKITVTVKTWLDKDASYFGRGYSLQGALYIAGAWRNVTLKKTTEYWKGKSGHTVSFSFTISNISATTTAFTGIKFKVTRPDGLGTAGVLNETACKNLPVSIFVTPQPETYYLSPTNYSTGNKWHGATITRTLPADASGAVGAKDCTFRYVQTMAIGTGKNATKELGSFQALLLSGNGSNRSIVAGVFVHKGSTGKTAELRFYVNGKIVYKANVDITAANKLFIPSKTHIITKSGQTVKFTVCGITKTFKVPEIKTIAVTEVTIGFLRWGSRTQLTHNGLHWMKFIKNNCDTWKDVPNKFSANDIVSANCRNGEILLNGEAEPELGALGNDWETFILKPGLNQIGTAYSEWVAEEYAPTFKVRYREVFL